MEIDTREPVLTKFNWNILGITPTFVALPVGDIKVLDYLLVERKRLPDFIQSVTSGRVYEQVEKLVEDTSTRKMIAIVGDTSYTCPKCGYTELSEIERIGLEFNPNIIYGAAASLYVRYGIEVGFFRDDWQMLNFLVRVERKLLEGKEGITRRAPIAVRRNPITARISWLAQITGVSPSLAVELLKKFDSIKNVANARLEDLYTIPGIGLSKAETIYNFFNKGIKEIIEEAKNNTGRDKA